MQIKLREPVSGLTHLAAAGFALIGLVILLVLGWGQPGKVISLLVYGISLITQFLASGIYHSAQASPETLLRLRKFDHAAIYLLIAGTYTPVCYNLLSGFWQWGLLSIVWGLALSGIGIKLFFINEPRWVTAGVYILMGWLCIFGFREMLAAIPAGALLWLAAGGLIYTLGAVIYITKWMDFRPNVFGFHEVWHIFVILGALAHYLAIAFYIAPPA